MLVYKVLCSVLLYTLPGTSVGELPAALLRAQSWETWKAGLGCFRGLARGPAACREAGRQALGGLWQCPMVRHFTFIATVLLSLLSLRWEAWLSGNHSCG